MLLRALAVVVLLANHSAPIDAWGQGVLPAVRGPFVGQAVMVGQSEAVHTLPVEAPLAGEGPVVEVNPRRLIGPPVPLPFGKPRLPDALAPSQAEPFAAERTPAATLSFDGMSSTGGVPPDPIGDVGPNHYVQMVNTRFAIFNKSGGLLAGPTDINVLFAGLGSGNQCKINNDGDPVVLYDRLADRWLLSQFAVPGGPSGFHVCIAISQTPDPTGSYFLYDFMVPAFPDYFKLGVWPDGYYMATNEDAPGTVGVFALDRARMLQGAVPSVIRFVVTDKNLLLPSDLDGVRPPPAGSPNYFYTFTDPSFWGGGGSDRLELFAFEADFTTPANSTFMPLPTIDVTAFNYTVCGYFVLACISQPSPGQTVDPVSEWPMWRFAYRNMKTHESLVGNFTVDVTATNQAGIRWFELRKTGAGHWTLFQEGTHAPDANHRWMGSIAMDANGNIALGYSVSSSSVNPSLRYATRLAGAALGTLEAEAVLVNGTGVQTNGSNRWGDYSAMSVDPADDCTFWYTGEYYATTSAASWRTRIGAFKIPSCAAPPPVNRDVNGDGKADMVWRHSGGAVAVWLMNGGAVSSVGLPGGAATDWTIAGLGDVNGDEKADIVWRHSSGTVALWLMDGAAVASVGLPGGVETDWTIAGVGDVNGDRKADIIWRHAGGAVAVWLMNGGAIGSVGFPGGAATDWTIAGVGDVNGDGKADIVWRHSSGAVAVWLMNGGAVASVESVGSAPPSWVIQ